MFGAKTKVPATVLSFGEEFRPVKLERYCYGYAQGERENDYQFDRKLNSVYLVDDVHRLTL